MAAREGSADGRVTAWAWWPVPPPGQGERTDRQHTRGLELHRAYESALAGQNIWQPVMLATGFFGQVFQVISGEIGAPRDGTQRLTAAGDAHPGRPPAPDMRPSGGQEPQLLRLTLRDLQSRENQAHIAAVMDQVGAKICERG